MTTSTSATRALLVAGLALAGCQGPLPCDLCVSYDATACSETESAQTWSYPQDLVADAGLTNAPCQDACNQLAALVAAQTFAAAAQDCSWNGVAPDGGDGVWTTLTCSGSIYTLAPGQTPDSFPSCQAACISMFSSSQTLIGGTQGFTFSCSNVGYTTAVTVPGDGTPWTYSADGGGPGLECDGSLTTDTTCSSLNPFNGWDGV